MGLAQTTKTADGRTLCFAEYGDLGGHPVVSLHPTPGCRLLPAAAIESDLEGLLRSLHIRLIRYDRPGYGGSTRREGRRIADSADDVEAVAEAVGVPRFAVKGDGGGALHALAVAALRPERVERLVLTGAAKPEPDGEVTEADLLHRIGEADAQAHAAAAGAEMQEAVYESTRNGLWGWLDDELAARKPWGFGLDEVHVRARLYNGGWPQLRAGEMAEGDAESLYSWLATG